MDLHAAPSWSESRGRPLKTLVDCCCEKIVQDSDMTRHAAESVPTELQLPLMREALIGNREISIQCLVASWKYDRLPLFALVPPLFRSVQPLVNMTYLRDIVKQGLRYTTSLAHTFMEVLKKNAPTRLKFLDLTSFPTAEVIVYFLATHCMLAHNEVRHETIRAMYEQAVQQANERMAALDSVDRVDMEPLEPMEHSLPQDCSVTVKLDAFVTSESTHSELCKALKVSSFTNRKLSIVIGRLAMMCLGQARISLLLKQLQPEFLTGLQLQYNSLTAHDFVKIAPALEKLVCLEALDLSCNTIFFHQHEGACCAIAQVFAHMPRLHRLDLSNNRIKTRLRRLLENISQPLTYLRMVGCGLTVTDLTYLTHSPHCSRLTELDLSENNLRQCERQFRDVIFASRTSLCVLEMENCSLDGEFVHSVVPSLNQLSCLMVFNVTENPLAQHSQVSLLASVAAITSLVVFKMSYSLECYEDAVGEDLRKAGALTELNSVANRIREDLHAKPLNLFLSELDRVT